MAENPSLSAILFNLLLDNQLQPADIVMGPRWVHGKGQVMGTLFKRGRNWYIDVRDQGRRIRKRVGPSKEVAILALKDAEVKIAKKEFGFYRPEVAIEAFFEEYLDFSRTNHSPNTTKR